MSRSNQSKFFYVSGSKEIIVAANISWSSKLKAFNVVGQSTGVITSNLKCSPREERAHFQTLHFAIMEFVLHKFIPFKFLF